MMPRYSIAEARNHFAELVHDLKHISRVEVTRRGRPVAILLSVEEFEMLCAGNITFESAYEAFRNTHDLANETIEPGIFDDLRDPSQGREMSW
jgi:prevent-host-death family protein